MDELKASSIHRNLETKIKVSGMEAADLLFILLFASIMNLIFGNTSLAPYFVFLLPAFMAVVLYFGKRGKPENYLVHLARFYLLPGYYSAGEKPITEDLRKRKIDSE